MSDNLENIISEALKLKEEGISFSEILKKFPDHKKDLEEIFGLAAFLEKEGKSINPSEGLLYNLINREKREESQFFIFAFPARLARALSVKQYAGLAVVLLLMIAAGFGFSYFSNSGEYAVSKTIKNLDSEISSFNQDASELEQIASDEGLQDIDEDMLALAELNLENGGNGAEEEKTADYRTDVSSLENELKGLEDDLSGYTADQSDIKSVGEDSSLDNLDSALSEIIS